MGKSEGILAIFRKMLAEDKDAKARVWVGDGSGATYTESGLVDDGRIQLCSWEGRDWPITTLYQAAEGYWPADPLDPRSPMIKPTPESFKGIKLWAFEGLSVGGGYILGDAKGGFANRGAMGEKIGQDAAWKIVDGETDRTGNAIPGKGWNYGGNSLSHWGAAQRRILGWIERAKALPGEFMFMTAHERAAEDKVTKENIIGPEAVGAAMTPTLPRYFHNTIRFAVAEKRLKEADDHTGRMVDVVDVEYRCYFRPHISPSTGMKYLAVARGGLMEDELPNYLVSATPGSALVEFYARLAAAREKRRITA